MGKAAAKTESELVVQTGERLLTRTEFQGLAEVPPEAEWFANIENPNTRRAYQTDLRGFMEFCGIQAPGEFRTVTRSHIIAWRKSLKDSGAGASTIRRKLSALSSLFDHLCESNSITHNPVNGVKRPKEGTNEGHTSALGNDQARLLLESPEGDSLKAVRDRAILSTLLFHGLRRDELCSLRVKDFSLRRGIMHLRVKGKGSKIRYVVCHPRTIEDVQAYLDLLGHGEDKAGALFRPVKNNSGKGKTKGLEKPLTKEAIYQTVLHYMKKSGIYFEGVCPHSLRATAATNALENDSDIARVQQWLGHASISTTRLYDKRESKPEDSPTLKVSY